MIRHPQRTEDDCTVCSVATYLDLPYETVLIAAKSTGYVPGSGRGASPGSVLEALGHEVHWQSKSINRYPCLASVKSINQDGGHCIVLTLDEVINPSDKKQVTEDMLPDILNFTYWVIT
jgi:hypothetical protein